MRLPMPVVAATLTVLAAGSLSAQAADAPAAKKPTIACQGNDKNLQTYLQIHKVLFTDRDYTPGAAKDARRLYYARQRPDAEADAALSKLCANLYGRVQIRALAARAGDIGGRMFGAVLRAIYAGDLLHLSRGQIAPTSFVGRPV